MNMHVDFRAQARDLEDYGIVLAHDARPVGWMPDAFKRNFNAGRLAMDAQPTLQTNPNAGVPAWLSSFVDPEVVRVLQAPNLGAKIAGERKMGDWDSSTAYFPMIENVGEVSSYGDYNTNGISEINAQWESRQAYLFQTHMTVGDLEIDRAAKGNINIVSEKQISCAKTLDKFLDYTYHLGVAGLENYGFLNDPSLPPALTPSTKAAGGTRWTTNGVPTAQASEIYTDFLTMFTQLAAQAPGYIDNESELVFVSPNAVAGAYGATNMYGITVKKFISETYPNVTFINDPRYATTAGNVAQLIAKSIDGNPSAYCGFNVKLRDHAIDRQTSSYLQKKTSGSYGAVIRYPLAIVTMIGI